LRFWLECRNPSWHRYLPSFMYYVFRCTRYVQQTTNSPVDMRVGIHTGAVLAGVLGQRQWQFDVYSKDVELANKMESSGMPGYVRAGNKTKTCIIFFYYYFDKSTQLIVVFSQTSAYIRKNIEFFEWRVRSRARLRRTPRRSA